MAADPDRISGRETRMIGTRVRRYLCGVLVLAAAGVVHGQATTVTFAGGKIVDNQPATSSSVIPTDVAVTPDGGILVVNYFTRTLNRRDPSTGILSRAPVGRWNQYPWDSVNRVFTGPTGDVYVLMHGFLSRVNLANGNWEDLAQFQTDTTCSDYYGAAKYAVDSAGTVYFTDTPRSRVCKVFGYNDVRPIAGTGLSGFSGDGGLASAARIRQPDGIAVDSANNIYFTDSG